ncbi:Pyridine nucleotide-disulphide oxidoreductase, NAD-binding domain [Lasallia pustulata]|uniref:Pyridine nucleotide-disulphide oxidoreductase, NAD-binding domain n=1 Tax=Lasallia pustulata TaxID=136370 RepID=A0A1W5CR36_9LECA|nr:Pyridine nucleotide-disulphide oxidoreductase, NAD-binding domain [Lasallia pustulata]
MASSNTHNIVIVGGNFSGVSVAHYLLRHTIPKLEAVNKSTTYKVTLITPSTHFFWKIAAPRAVADPKFDLDKIFLPIADGFKDYPSDHYAFVQGTATSISPDPRTITVTLESSSDTTVAYSTLIIASGAKSTSPLWAFHGAHTLTASVLSKYRDALRSAKTILVAGGGAAGVETAGEIAACYPHAQKTILSGASRLLPRLRPAIGKAAEQHLLALGFEVVHDTKVTSSAPPGTETPTRTTLALSDGTTRTVDAYLDATGATPNTAFVPQAWLSPHGHVLTDAPTLRATAAPRGVYAIGDVASYSRGSTFDIIDAVAPLCSSVLVDLSAGVDAGADPAPAAAVDAQNRMRAAYSSWWPGWAVKAQDAKGAQRFYKQGTAEMQVVPCLNLPSSVTYFTNQSVTFARSLKPSVSLN